MDTASTETDAQGSSSDENGDVPGESTAGPDLGATDGTTSPAVDCHQYDQYDDERGEAEPVTFRLVNAGSAPIVLDSPCSSHDFFSLASSLGATWPAGFCTGTCQQQFEFGCAECDGCAASMYELLGPGEHIDITWSGDLYESILPHIDCAGDYLCGETCPRRRLPAAEEITATVVAIPYADCIALEPDPSVCECLDWGEGCYGQAYLEPTLSASVTIAPGTAGPIVLEIVG